MYSFDPVAIKGEYFFLIIYIIKAYKSSLNHILLYLTHTDRNNLYT